MPPKSKTTKNTGNTETTTNNVVSETTTNAVVPKEIKQEPVVVNVEENKEEEKVEKKKVGRKKKETQQVEINAEPEENTNQVEFNIVQELQHVNELMKNISENIKDVNLDIFNTKEFQDAENLFSKNSFDVSVALRKNSIKGVKNLTKHITDLGKENEKLKKQTTKKTRKTKKDEGSSSASEDDKETTTNARSMAVSKQLKVVPEIMAFISQYSTSYNGRSEMSRAEMLSFFNELRNDEKNQVNFVKDESGKELKGRPFYVNDGTNVSQFVRLICNQINKMDDEHKQKYIDSGIIDANGNPPQYIHGPFIMKYTPICFEK
jgi:hypothetical protein